MTHVSIMLTMMICDYLSSKYCNCIFGLKQMNKDNGTYTSSDEDEDIIQKPVDLPSTAKNILFYIEHHTVYHFTPNTYYIDGKNLYVKSGYMTDLYYRYDLEENAGLRLPLRLKNPRSTIFAEADILRTDERLFDEKYIEQLDIYSRDGECRSYFTERTDDEGTECPGPIGSFGSIPDYLLDDN